MTDDRRSLFHRVVERILPWYDPEAEARRNERTEAIRQRSIAARIKSEQVRADYGAMAEAIPSPRRRSAR